jgi:hypothetical protein
MAHANAIAIGRRRTGSLIIECSGPVPNVTLNPPSTSPSNVTLPVQRTSLMPPRLGRQVRCSEAPARRWPDGPARPSPHAPASASRSRCARSPDRLLRGWRWASSGDVGSCGAISPTRHHPRRCGQPGLSPSSDSRPPARGTTCRNSALQIPSVVPRHRAGQRMFPNPTGEIRCGARALSPDVVTIACGKVASLPGNESGAQAGIEPATGAWVTHQIGSARPVQKLSTHLHQFGATGAYSIG